MTLLDRYGFAVVVAAFFMALHWKFIGRLTESNERLVVLLEVAMGMREEPSPSKEKSG